MAYRIFISMHDHTYYALTDAQSLVRCMNVRTPEGVMQYYIFDGKTYRKTFVVLVRQLDGLYRVYYRDRKQFTGRKFTQSIAQCYRCRPVKVLSYDELPRLLEPAHLEQMAEADKMMRFAEPAATVE